MAIDLKGLEDSLHTILEPVVKTTDSEAILVIEPNDGLVPNTSFASMKLKGMQKSGYTEIGIVESNGEVPVRANYTISFTFSAFGKNSKNILADLSFAITENLLIEEALSAINLFQYNQPDYTDTPIFRDTYWEENEQITISFHYAHEELVNVGVIEQVTIDGDYLNLDDTLKLHTTQTITLP